MGSADIQSLADLSNSYEVIKDIKWVPFSMSTVLQLAVTEAGYAQSPMTLGAGAGIA